MVELHGEGEGVEHDRHEDSVLAKGAGGERPQLVLDRVLGDVSPDWLSIQREFYAVPLKEDRISKFYSMQNL